MKKNKTNKEKLSLIHSGMRLKTKPPKKETPATVYSRKDKHKRRFDTSSFSLMESYFSL